MYVTLTVPGSAIRPGDQLAVKDWREVEEIGVRTAGTTSLYILDGGTYIVGDDREYVVCREVEERTAPAPVAALVVGPTATRADRKALRALAHAISFETGRPATWATHTDHDVRDYAAVYTTCAVTELRTDPALLLVAEALAAGVDVHEPLTSDEVVECPCGLVTRHTRTPVDENGEPWCAECSGNTVCGWCGDAFEDDAVFVERGTAVHPLHAECAAEIDPASVPLPVVRAA